MSNPHVPASDPRNDASLVYVDGRLVPRGEAVVSVFDSGFLMGDGVWEGLRVHNGRAAFLGAHLDRLYEGTRAIDLPLAKYVDRDAMTAALYRTLEANRMRDGVHVRLMVTRGLKRTPFQGTSVNVGPPTVVIVAEYKVPDPAVVARGIKVFTTHVRRGGPDVLDPALNSHSRLDYVTASIQADKAGADEALMLDPHGFVATCNSTHFFVVRGGEVWTSTGRYCLRGITRANVIRLAGADGIGVRETDFSLTQVYSADEVFVTGTFAGIVPVRDVDGRSFPEGAGPVTARLQALYAAAVAAECA